MATQNHVNPRFRAYGRARLEIAQRATTREEWNDLWKPPQNSFPFQWGRHWKHCVEYRVDDYTAEAGFYIDVLGFPVNAFDPQYAQFTGPDGEFFIAFMPANEDLPATPPEALRLQFMVADIEDTAAELERRGVAFSQQPRPLAPGSNLLVASFHTPHGIQVDLWGEAMTAGKPVQPAVARPANRPAVRRSTSEQPETPRPAPRPVTRIPAASEIPARTDLELDEPRPRRLKDEPRIETDQNSDEIPQVEHFFPVRAPGRPKPAVKKKLKIRLADPRPLILREPV